MSGARGALRALLLSAAQVALPSPSPSPLPSPAASATPAGATVRFVRGGLLALSGGYLLFTTGDALRVRAGTPLPPRAALGSVVRATLDPVARDVTALELDPGPERQGEIDAAALPREYAVASPASARTPAPAGPAAGGAARGLVTVTIVAHVPADTPLTDDVYVATERSNYNPSEIRMQRIDADTFSTSLGLEAGSRLRYQFTRGTFATIERASDGSIASPHTLDVAPGAKSSDTVARWADII